MGRWFIVRHGETEWNAQGRIQGHTDVVLSQKGQQQALRLAHRLAEEPIDLAYSSDLSRAKETAQIILSNHEAPFHTTPRLRERYYGVFEGLTAEERNHRYPEQFAASLVKDLDFAPTGGESTRQTCERMATLVTELKANHLDDSVLVVGHGGTLRAVFVSLMELPLEAMWRFVMANCSLSIIDTYEDNAVLCLYNDTSHLNGLGPGH